MLGLCLVLGTGLLMGTHTEYCPWKHVLLNTESCVLRDRRAGLVLIEHHDADDMYNSNNYLEIREGSQSHLLKLPGNGLSIEGSVELIPGAHAAISINNQRKELIPF